MARYRIQAPGKVTGEVAGVHFVRGVAADAEPTRAALAYFARHTAYQVTRLDGPPADEPATEQADPETPPPSPVTPPTGQDETKRPGRWASKVDWVAYAVSLGMPADEAEALTIAKLAERFAGDGSGGPGDTSTPPTGGQTEGAPQ